MDQLICKSVMKKYGKKQVLHDVNLTLEKGKIYGLIGRNGAGKTTLLSIMASHNPASGGLVEWNGENVWENQKALAHICFSREIMSSGNTNGGNGMKVKELLKMASLYYPNWDKKMADQLIQDFEVNVKKRLNALSKGMLSMLTITIAMASKADFTFLDEPVAGLDVVMREFFYRRLLEEYAETGRTFVVSTHIIEEAADVFDEVIMVREGSILLKENTQDLLERCYQITGLEEVVDEVIDGLEVHRVMMTGRSKSVCVMLRDGQKIPQGYDVTVQPLNLQNVFVALCGKEA